MVNNLSNINKTLEQEDRIIELAKTFKNKFNALFLGRGSMHARFLTARSASKVSAVSPL
jgi:glucosamine 6-phosphate synthetase-like amidotransferase/phosphosugar isomerase protein